MFYNQKITKTTFNIFKNDLYKIEPEFKGGNRMGTVTITPVSIFIKNG